MQEEKLVDDVAAGTSTGGQGVLGGRDLMEGGDAAAAVRRRRQPGAGQHEPDAGEAGAAMAPGVLEKRAEELARNLVAWVGSVAETILDSAPTGWHVLEEEDDKHAVPRAERTTKSGDKASPGSSESDSAPEARASRELVLARISSRRRGRSPTVKRTLHSADMVSDEDDYVETYQI